MSWVKLLMISLFSRKFLPNEIVLSLVEYYEKNDIFFKTSEYYESLKKELLLNKKIAHNTFKGFIHNSRNNIYTDFFFVSRRKKNIKKAIEKNIFCGDILYLKPNLWDKSTSIEFEHVLKECELNYLIIDLRGSPGGYLKTCINICNLLLPKCEIVSLNYRNKKTTIYSDQNYKKFKKIFILVDKMTASSSEILSYSLYTNLNNVVLLGEKTFGKNFGQDKIFNKKYNFCFIVPSFFWGITGFSYDNISMKPIKKSFLDEVNSYVKFW